MKLQAKTTAAFFKTTLSKYIKKSQTLHSGFFIIYNSNY